MNTKNKIKLIFFDMDGTLYKKTSQEHNVSSPWTLVAKNLGQEALKRKENLNKMWKDKKYSSYVKWMEDNFKNYTKHNLTKKIFYNTIESVKFHDGVKDLFDHINAKGYKTVLISGGFKALADKASINLKIDHVFAACEFYWGGNGKLHHCNLLPSDFEGKIDFMRLIMREYGFKKSECAFVGDGTNDIPLARKVGFSISFNGSKELEKVVNVCVRQKPGEEDISVLKKYF